MYAYTPRTLGHVFRVSGIVGFNCTHTYKQQQGIYTHSNQAQLHTHVQTTARNIHTQQSGSTAHTRTNNSKEYTHTAIRLNCTHTYKQYSRNIHTQQSVISSEVSSHNREQTCYCTLTQTLELVFSVQPDQSQESAAVVSGMYGGIKVQKTQCIVQQCLGSSLIRSHDLMHLFTTKKCITVLPPVAHPFHTDILIL